MENYSIGEVCRLLGVKAHILRYWEQELPLLSPRKDAFGKRIYLENDLHVLFRIRYLVQEEKLTLEGVNLRLWREMEPEDPDFTGRIRQIRGELLGMYRILCAQKKRLSRLNGADGSADNEFDEPEN